MYVFPWLISLTRMSLRCIPVEKWQDLLPFYGGLYSIILWSWKNAVGDPQRMLVSLANFRPSSSGAGQAGQCWGQRCAEARMQGPVACCVITGANTQLGGPWPALRAGPAVRALAAVGTLAVGVYLPDCWSPHGHIAAEARDGAGTECTGTQLVGLASDRSRAAGQ